MRAAKEKNREAFNEALKINNETMEKILDTFVKMWQLSRPDAYNNFRTFIMGIKN